jgi:hypothetical protein
MKFPNKSIFILNEFRMIFPDHKRIKIEMDAFVLSKEMKEVFKILETFQIEKFVCFEPEDLPNHLEISYDIARRFQNHLEKNFKKHKVQKVDNDERFFHIEFKHEEGKIFKIHFLFGQKMESIKKVEQK